jgi:glycosyltransferase 2 family protein
MKENLVRLWRRSQIIFTLVAAAVVAVFFYRHRIDLGILIQSVSPMHFAVAAMIFAAMHIVIASAFHLLHLALGVQKNYFKSIDGYLLRLPARYIPGGFWHSASRYADMHSSKTAAGRDITRIFLAENAAVAATGLILGAVAAWVVPLALPSYLGLLMLAAGIGVALTVLALKLSTQTTVQWSICLLGVAFLALNWLGLSTAFALFGSGLAATTECALPILGASYLIAAVGGFVAIFAPQGWGITELIFSLSKPCGESALVSVASITGFRLLTLLADVSLFFMWWAMRSWVLRASSTR